MSQTLREQLMPFAHGTQRGCIKKTRYAGKGLAMKVRDARAKVEPEHLYIYNCQHCGGWHITKLKPPGE